MEFFKGAKVVKLRSHLDKYLLADDDGETVRQSRNAASRKAMWAVEPSVQGNGRFIRLRSCHGGGKYLMASDTFFLLGATGKKVTQSDVATKWDPRVDWEPVRDGLQVKLKTAAADGGRTFLRGNGGMPPWRNSVTHDSPHTGATRQWVLWDVEVVIADGDDEAAAPEYLSYSSFSSLDSDSVVGSEPPSPMSVISGRKAAAPARLISKSVEKGMDLFRNAKAVRLRSHHNKYLTAEEDEESVTQDRSGAAKAARWTVEFSGDNTTVRLKSCYGKYLTASNQPFLLGMTGCKATQSLPDRGGGSSVEWVPIREGPALVKLRTRYGNFLRANGGLPPWRNSITHDVPHRTSTQDWILWEIEIVEILQSHSPTPKPSSAPPLPGEIPNSSSYDRQESIDSAAGSPPKMEGRTIYYGVTDERGEVDDEVASFSFKGNGVEELTRKLQEETGLEDIVVCSRSPLNGKLYPLRLHLPPNNATIHVVVVPSSSKVARDFAT